MKKYYLLFILLLTSIGLKAQKVIRTIKKDTINITGYVLKYDGTPAGRDVFILSQNKELNSEAHRLGTGVDDNGCFILNGAKLNDTLIIQWANYRSNDFKVANRGARYMVIMLPPDQPLKIDDTIKIAAVRKYKTKTPSFQITENDFSIRHIFLSHQAMFPGGTKKFAEFINSKITYPQKAIDKNIEGNVEIGFTIERDGTLIDIKVLRGIGYGCDEEVINAVKASPKWTPALSGGPIKMQSSINVEFKLIDK